MASLTVRPAEDDAGQKDCNIANGGQQNNANNSGTLLVGTLFVLAASTYWRALLRMPLTQLPAMSSVSAAVFTLTFDGGAPTVGATYTANRLTQANWTEGATWNTYDGSNAWNSAGGDYTATNSASVVYASGATLAFNVLAMLNDARSAGLNYLDLILRGPESAGVSNYVVGLSSSESTVLERPKLEITYAPGFLHEFSWCTKRKPLEYAAQ